jgi:Na+/proline symporter
MNTISILGILAVVIYTAVILYICFRSARHPERIDTGRKFFLGTGTKIFILLFTTIASTFSTWVFMGAPASTYLYGHTWIALVVLYQMSLTFVCGYLGPRFWVLRHKYDLVTQSDLVVRYYKSNSLRYVMAGCFIVSLSTATIAQFKGMGTAIFIVSGGVIPFWAASLFIGVTVGFYVYFGGFHGEALVETFQGILFTTILFGGLIVMLSKMGGLGGLFEKIAAHNPQLLLYQGQDAYWNPQMAISFCLVALVGGFFHPGFWQRYYAAKNTRTLIKMSVWFPFMVSILICLTGGLVGLAANLYDLNLTSTDAVFQTLLSTVSSPYWGVMVTIGVLAAGMSTLSGNSNGAALIISYDFIRYLKKDASDSYLRNVGRKSVIVLVALAYLFALKTPDSVTMLIQLMAAFNLVALYPVIGIFLWKRATVEGCFSAMVGGFITICVTNFVFKNPLGIVAGGWGFGVGVLLFVIVSLLTKPIPDKQRQEFLKPLKDARSLAQTRIN